MGGPWKALSKALAALIDGVKVDWAFCVAFGSWALGFMSDHWLWLSLWIGSVCCYSILLYWWSRDWALFPFRYTRHLFMCLHDNLWLSILDMPIMEETKSKDAGKETAKSSKPASLRKHRRLQASRSGYGMVEPVIGESARRLTTMIPSLDKQ